jgi:hypothetical protein
MTDAGLMTIDAQTGEAIASLTLREVPADTLAAAQRAAAALQNVIARKKKPVLFGGEQYLEFEDWQTVGRFYGVTAKAVSVDPVTFGSAHGFKAVGVAQLADGREISRAEALCLGDEANWAHKPLYQLASMAQTRACAKALRNVLAWVVVLAGYRATPAEEMGSGDAAPIRRPPSRPAPAPRVDLISAEQRAAFVALVAEHGWQDAEVIALLKQHGIAKSSQIPREKFTVLCDAVKLGPSVSLADLEA